MNALEELISLFRQNEEYELEMCLRPKSGHMTLSKEVYDLRKQVLLRSMEEKLVEGFPIDKYWDFFYEDNVRMRCRLNVEPEVIRKTPITKLIAVCPQRDFAFHFHLKQEVVFKDWESLQTKKKIYARFQQDVMRFRYKDAYEYVLKTVFEAPTKESAAAQPAKYEMELELLHNIPYLDSKPDDEHATSFVEKALDLCGRYNSKNNTPEKLTMAFLVGGVQEPSEPIVPVKKTKGRKKKVIDTSKQQCVDEVLKKQARPKKQIKKEE